MRPHFLVLLLCSAVACARTPEQEEASLDRSPPSDRDWELVELGDRTDPLGAGGRPATIRFEAGGGRAGGFGGCNRWSAQVTIAGDSLRFSPAIATKMACAEGMELETAFFTMLDAVRRYQMTDSTLTLLATDAPLAQFRLAER